MDNEKYKDIAPYKGEEVERAKERLLSKKEYLGAFACIIAGNDIEKINNILLYISSQMDKVHSYFDSEICNSWYIYTCDSGKNDRWFFYNRW